MEERRVIVEEDFAEEKEERNPGVDAQSILAAYQRIPDETFPITLSGGEVVYAKKIQGTDEILRLNKDAEDFYTSIKKKRLPEELKQYTTRPITKETAQMCMYVHRLCVNPSFSIPQVLQIATQCGALLLELANPIMKENFPKTFAEEAEEIEETKN